MRYALKDYQVDAVSEVLRNLADARDDVRRRNRRIAFALSATTGAGKTVMSTAVIEALFRGAEEFDVEADPSATVLWVTDDKNLNEQTRHRFIEAGDRLEVSQLQVIDEGFQEETFAPGHVYFLNIQKLRADTTYVTRNEARNFTLWDTIQNTIEAVDLTLYLVLDEAHKGMRSGTSRTTEERNRSTIVQRLINGHNSIPQYQSCGAFRRRWSGSRQRCRRHRSRGGSPTQPLQLIHERYRSPACSRTQLCSISQTRQASSTPHSCGAPCARYVNNRSVGQITPAAKGCPIPSCRCSFCKSGTSHRQLISVAIST